MVSLVLVQTEEGVQKPVYYVSKSLQEVKTREGHLGHHTCHEEASTLLPGLYSCLPHLTSLTSFAPEIRFHQENGKVGDHIKGF